MKFYNDIINKRIDYNQKNKEKIFLIKKNQEMRNKENEKNKEHIPVYLLNGLKNTINPHSKKFRISHLNNPGDSHFNPIMQKRKNSFKKKLPKSVKNNSLLKKFSKITGATNTSLKNKKNKENEDLTLLGLQSQVMNNMIYFHKKKKNFNNEKLLETLRIANCQIDQYFKNRIKSNIPIEFGKDLKKVVETLQAKNIKSNRIMSNCKSTLKMKKNENLQDEMKFYFYVNQNEMKHQDQIKDIIVKHEISIKKKKNLDVILDTKNSQRIDHTKSQVDNTDKLINKEKENFLIKKNSKKWKDIIIKRIIKKEKDFSDLGILKSSFVMNKEFKQETAFIETKELIKNYMEEIEKKLLRQKNDHLKPKKKFSLGKNYKNEKK